jgi:hypothetical protein
MPRYKPPPIPVAKKSSYELQKDAIEREKFI